DVAREAGCSRATVYRAFPGGKDAVVAATVRAECQRLARGLASAVDGLGSLEDILVAAIVHTGRFLSGHQALRFLLAHEPEAILPVTNTDVDETLHAVRSNYDTIFTWDYDKGERPALNKLYEKAKKSQWNGETDLPWETPVDQEAVVMANAAAQGGFGAETGVDL